MWDVHVLKFGLFEAARRCGYVAAGMATAYVALIAAAMSAMAMGRVTPGIDRRTLKSAALVGMAATYGGLAVVVGLSGLLLLGANSMFVATLLAVAIRRVTSRIDERTLGGTALAAIAVPYVSLAVVADPGGLVLLGSNLLFVMTFFVFM